MPESNENLKFNEIQKLEKQLAEKKAALEMEAPQVEKKEAEITKENLPEQPSQITSVQQTTIQTDDQEEKEKVKNDIKTIKDMDTARQIKVLAVLAFEKGINYSVKVARGLNSAYLLDELHDQLVGELHEELIKKGKLKEL